MADKLKYQIEFEKAFAGVLDFRTVLAVGSQFYAEELTHCYYHGFMAAMDLKEVARLEEKAARFDAVIELLEDMMNKVHYNDPAANLANLLRFIRILKTAKGESDG